MSFEPVFNAFCFEFYHSLQRVQDYTNYFLNLTDANQTGNLTWQVEYNAKVGFTANISRSLNC